MDEEEAPYYDEVPETSSPFAGSPYEEPYERLREMGEGFSALPGGVNVEDMNAVATGLEQAGDGRRSDFYDRDASPMHIPRKTSENSKGDTPYFHDGYARMIWDYIQGNIFQGRDINGRDTGILYRRDVDRSPNPRILQSWHVLDMQHEYGIPKTQWNPAWNQQMIYETSKLKLRVLHGIRFNNIAFLRMDSDSDVTTVTPGNDLFYYPFELSAPVDYDEGVEAEAERWLRFVTPSDPSDEDYDNGHSFDNLTRFFATPLLEPYKHLSYVLYGGGGNGKGILTSSLADTFNSQTGEDGSKIASSVDTQKLLGGQRGNGGFSTDQEVLKLNSALWAYDPEADEVTLEQMTNLKRISTGDPLVARRIQENAVEIRPKATFAICTNNPVITTMTPAAARRIVFVRMRDGRSASEFTEMRKYIAEHGAYGFLMASCKLWLSDSSRRQMAEESGGKFDEFHRDVVIGSPDDLTPAQEWIVDQIALHRYAVSAEIPKEDATERKNTIAKLGLRSTVRRINKVPTRVLVVGDEGRFRPYERASKRDFHDSDVSEGFDRGGKHGRPGVSSGRVADPFAC